MNKKLWEASKVKKKHSNLYKYEKFLSKKHKLKVTQNYSKILNWSINNPNKFWSSIWDFTKVKGIKKEKSYLSKILFKSKFLINSKLNFAENLLSKNDNTKSITFISENGYREVRSWKDLNLNVNKISYFFKKINLKKNHRVAAYLPNLIETVEAFIATTSIGAIWSSCSPDFGADGVIERFVQIKPRILIIADRYYYNGKEINVIERLPVILKKIKSIKNIIIVNYPGKSYLKFKKINKVKINFWKEIKKTKPKKLLFNPPVYIAEKNELSNVSGGGIQAGRYDYIEITQGNLKSSISKKTPLLFLQHSKIT